MSDTREVPDKTKVDTDRATMAGNLTLTGAPRYRFLDPDGSDRIVTVTDGQDQAYVIKHIGSANTITVKNVAAETLVTLSATDTATVVHDGTVWQVL